MQSCAVIIQLGKNVVLPRCSSTDNIQKNLSPKEELIIFLLDSFQFYLIFFFSNPFISFPGIYLFLIFSHYISIVSSLYFCDLQFSLSPAAFFKLNRELSYVSMYLIFITQMIKMIIQFI